MYFFIKKKKKQPGGGSLRSSDDFSQQGGPQYESLQIKVKALENQIDELNKDRKVLSACKEDLSIKLDETEHEITKRNDALNMATLKFNMEKKLLSDENARFKKELGELNETRRSLQSEIDGLRAQLGEKNSLLERISAERDETGKQRKSNDSEVSMLKEQQSGLLKKLEDAELKLMSAEKDAKYAKSQIEMREKQIVELRDQLTRTKTEFDVNMALFQREKEDKERLVGKCDQLEASIKKHVKEIHELKQQNQSQQSQQNASLPPSGPSDSNSYSNESYYKLNAMEKENIKLHDDLKRLIDKLQRTESELEKYKINAELDKLNNLSATSNSNQNVAQNLSGQQNQRQNHKYQGDDDESPYAVSSDNAKLKVDTLDIYLNSVFGFFFLVRI